MCTYLVPDAFRSVIVGVGDASVGTTVGSSVWGSLLSEVVVIGVPSYVVVVCCPGFGSTVDDSFDVSFGAPWDSG